MSEEFKDPIEPEPMKPESGKSLSWSQVWIQATTRPSLETYQRLLADPGASANKAYLWVFVTYFLGGLITFLFSFVFTSPFAYLGDYGEITTTAVFGSAIIQLVCCLPFVAIMGVIGLMITSALTQLVARLLGGDGRYEQLVYLFGAITAPLSLVTFAISAIPFLNCLTVLLAIYIVVLLIIAVNAVNNFGYGRAIVAYFAIPLLLIIITICVTVAMFAVLAPEIDAVFNDIINALETPVPQF